jgi:hypothetical protein
MDTRPKLDKINLVIQYIYFFYFLFFLVLDNTDVVTSTVNDPRLFLDGE